MLPKKILKQIVRNDFLQTNAATKGLPFAFIFAHVASHVFEGVIGEKGPLKKERTSIYIFPGLAFFEFLYLSLRRVAKRAPQTKSGTTHYAPIFIKHRFCLRESEGRRWLSVGNERPVSIILSLSSLLESLSFPIFPKQSPLHG